MVILRKRRRFCSGEIRYVIWDDGLPGVSQAGGGAAPNPIIENFVFFCWTILENFHEFFINVFKKLVALPIQFSLLRNNPADYGSKTGWKSLKLAFVFRRLRHELSRFITVSGLIRRHFRRSEWSIWKKNKEKYRLLL